MGDLPQVYFEEHPEWTELYNISWQLHKSKIQRIPAATNPEQPYYVDEAFSGNIFVWDTIFMMLYDRYGMNQFPILSSLENFYYCQTDSEGKQGGYIPREIIESSGKDFWGGYTDETSTNPPLFSWAEWSCYQIHGDVTRFSKVIDGKTIYERLCDHYEFIEKNKRVRYKLYGKTNGLSTLAYDHPSYAAGNEGFMFCADAATEQRTVCLQVSVSKGAKGVLSASLSDASMEEQVITLEEGRYLITIPYSAASDGRYLLVKWCLDNSTLQTEKTEDPAFSVSLDCILLSKNN